MPILSGKLPFHVLSLASRRQWVLRMGFAALLILLGISVSMAYRIQRGLSEEAAQTYRAYIQREESLNNVRRSLWQTSIHVRDLLLDAAPDREAKFATTVSLRKQEAAEALGRLKKNPIPGQNLERVHIKLDEFWATVAAVPFSTRNLSQAQRYDFVQSEVAARRLALSDLVREVLALSQSSLAATERRLGADRQLANLRLLILLVLALLAGLVFAFLSLRRLDALEAETVQRYEEVSRTKAELRALSAQLMSIQEIERARLSRELHDEIGQAMATLRLELARFESSVRDDLPDVHARLTRARAIVDSTVKTTRNISLMLRPSLLDDLGLVAAVQWLAEDSARRTGIPSFVQGEHECSDLPVEVRTCAYRVAQEALHNAEKHAGAERIMISLERSADSLQIRVDDDGCGIEGEAIDRWKNGAHLGILGMRERVGALSGKFSIGPAPGGGTRVQAWLPLTATAADTPLVEQARVDA